MVAAVTAQAALLGGMTVYNFPSEFGRVSGLGAFVVQESQPDARISEFGAMVVYRGRVADPNLAVWTFTLDGHDFYVLRLGDTETLVHDVYSEKWTVWGSGTSPRWRAKTGINWQGAGAVAGGYGSTIVVGDETFGTLYFLDPEYALDDDPQTGSEGAQTFLRVAQGQIPHRGRDPLDDFGVSLSGAFGNVLGGVTLSISDDNGNTYDDCGTITVDPGDYSPRVEWSSLGMIVAPGRLYKIEDDGLLARIDSLDRLADAES